MTAKPRVDSEIIGDKDDQCLRLKPQRPEFTGRALLGCLGVNTGWILLLIWQLILPAFLHINATNMRISRSVCYMHKRWSGAQHSSAPSISTLTKTWLHTVCHCSVCFHCYSICWGRQLYR